MVGFGNFGFRSRIYKYSVKLLVFGVKMLFKKCISCC